MPTLFDPLIEPPQVGMLQPERNFLKWLATDPRQQRIKPLYIGSGLTIAARTRAKYYSDFRGVDRGANTYNEPAPHMLPGGPFKDIVAAGVKMPGPGSFIDYMQLYADHPDGNYCESSTAGWNTAKEAYMALVEHAAHTPHILGDGDMFRRQNLIACGYHNRCWIFLSLPTVSG